MSKGYALIRSDRKSLSVEVRRDGQVVIHAPLMLPRSKIEDFVREHRDWIAEKSQQAAANTDKARSLLTEGGIVPFLGGGLKLHFYGGSLPMRTNGELLLPRDRPAAFYDWRLSEAELLLRPRVNYWADLCDIHPTALCFGCARERWGSMRADGVMRLNTALLHRPMNQIDYVIVHELCHRLHPDHSPAFHAAVRSFLPEADRIRGEMKKQGPPLHPEAETN